MFLMKNMQDLYEHISYVLLSAPDRFPVEDFLKQEDQMTLDKAFEQLHEGVWIAYPEDEFSEVRAELGSLLDQSLAAYRANDRSKGAHVLQEFESKIFKT